MTVQAAILWHSEAFSRNQTVALAPKPVVSPPGRRCHNGGATDAGNRLHKMQAEPAADSVMDPV